MSFASALNPGIITRQDTASRREGVTQRTIIVTGVARSGTSLIAGLLRAAGLHMGDLVYDVVNEDAHMLEIVRGGDKDLLRSMIQQRNAQHDNWGFKIPNLHSYLSHNEIGLFRNPHLIVIYRDPVAVAVRNARSEHIEELQGLIAATGAMQAVARFAAYAKCPLLLLSYEKSITVPPVMIDSVLNFCGLTADPAARDALQRQVVPNNPAYLTAATRHFVGRIDGLMDGELYGWCYQENRLEPVRLEIHADDRLIDTCDADQYREDLAAGGVGNGCHGFSVELARHKLRADAVIRVKIAGRLLELENSGQHLRQFHARVSAR